MRALGKTIMIYYNQDTDEAEIKWSFDKNIEPLPKGGWSISKKYKGGLRIIERLVRLMQDRQAEDFDLDARERYGE